MQEGKAGSCQLGMENRRPVIVGRKAVCSVRRLALSPQQITGATANRLNRGKIGVYSQAEQLRTSPARQVVYA
jgi:hypothetical protein